jgi:hypothetical protein
MSGIEFTVGEPPKPEPSDAEKLVTTPVPLGPSPRGLGVIDGQTVADRAAAKVEQVLLDEMAPALEIQMPEIGAPQSELLQATPNQTAMTNRAKVDPGDPTVLLQGLLGQLPGVDGIRAADMAMGTDLALHNLGAKAERMAMLEEREAKRIARERMGGGRKGRRRR